MIEKVLYRCYFTGSEVAENLDDEEVMMYEDNGKYFMAHNGKSILKYSTFLMLKILITYNSLNLSSIEK